MDRDLLNKLRRMAGVPQDWSYDKTIVNEEQHKSTPPVIKDLWDFMQKNRVGGYQLYLHVKKMEPSKRMMIVNAVREFLESEFDFQLKDFLDIADRYKFEDHSDIKEGAHHSSTMNPDSIPHPDTNNSQQPELNDQYNQYSYEEEEDQSMQHEELAQRREKAKELAVMGVENTLHYLRQMARDTDDPDLRHYYNFRLYEDWERHILRNLRADRFDLVRQAYNSFHYPKEKNIWMEANKKHPEIIEALEMLFQEKAVFEAEQPKKEVDSKTRNTVVAALKNVVNDLLDEAKEAADNDMKKLFKADAEQYNNIMKSVQAGMHRAARRMYDVMDTGARDHWIDAPIDKESKKVVADYFGVNLLHEGLFNRNRMTMNDVMLLINKMGPDEAAEHVREKLSKNQRLDLQILVNRKTSQMTRKKQDNTKEYENLMNFLAVLIGAPSQKLINHARKVANMSPDWKPSSKMMEEKEHFKTKGKFKKGQLVKYKGENVVVVVPDAKADFVGVVPVGQEENMEDVDLVRAHLLTPVEKVNEEWNKSKTVKAGHYVMYKGEKYHVSSTSKHNDVITLVPLELKAGENPTHYKTVDAKEVKVLKESMHYHTNDAYPETHGSATNPINVDKGRIPTVFDYNTHVDDMQKPEDYEMANDTTQVRVPSNVLNDLRDVIEDLKKEAEKSKPRDFDRAHYYEDTAEAFQIVHDHLAMKTVEGLKRAQYLSMRMMNVQRALMPNHVWNFIMNGGEKRGLKDYMNSVNRRYPVSAKNFDTVRREELNKNTHTE